MFFQYNRARGQINLDMSNNPLQNFPTQTDPRDSLRRNIIKPSRNFNSFKQPIIQLTDDLSTRSVTIFQKGMIENVTAPAKNCSSCGGAK